MRKTEIDELREAVRLELNELADNVCPDVKTTDCYARLMRLVGVRHAYHRIIDAPDLSLLFKGRGKKYFEPRDAVAQLLDNAGLDHDTLSTKRPQAWRLVAYAINDADRETLKALGFKRGEGK